MSGTVQYNQHWAIDEVLINLENDPFMLIVESLSLSVFWIIFSDVCFRFPGHPRPYRRGKIGLVDDVDRDGDLWKDDVKRQ